MPKKQPTRSDAQLKRDLLAFRDEIGHIPMPEDVDARAKQGKMSSTSTYVRRLGTIDGRRSWNNVLLSCDLEPQPDRRKQSKSGRGSLKKPTTTEPSPASQQVASDIGAAEESIADLRSELRRVKTYLEHLSSKAEAAEGHLTTLDGKLDKVKSHLAKSDYSAASQDEATAARESGATSERPAAEPSRAPLPPSATVQPLAASAESVARIVNLTGEKVCISQRRGRSKYLLPSGRISISSETFKYFDDKTTDAQLKQALGIDVQIKKVSWSYCMVSNDGKHYPLPPPQAGIYYLMTRKTADYIGSTGRSMEDLIFPLEYQKATGLLVVSAIGIKQP